jgi:hypothetical protein
MMSSYRKSKNYDGPGVTNTLVSDLLTKALSRIGHSYQGRPDLILAAWPDLVGQKLAVMTEAVSFQDGILNVKVKNSTLYSLLNQNDKPRLLNLLRKQFPKVLIRTIVFRMG